MLRFAVFLTVFSISCLGNTQVVVEFPWTNKCFWTHKVISTSMVKFIWIEPTQKLDKKFVLASVNLYWSELGLTLKLVSSYKKANYVVGFTTYNQCNEPITIGTYQKEKEPKIPAILVDTTCITKLKDYKQRFPAAISHAFANLVGVEGYPPFCGKGILNNHILNMTEDNIPFSVTAKDKLMIEDDSIFKVKSKYICQIKAPWICGTYKPTELKKWTFKLISKRLKPKLIEDSLNKYFKVVGLSFVATTTKNPDFTIKEVKTTKKNCNQLAIAHLKIKTIFLDTKCLKLDEEYWIESLMVHEVGHLLGLAHIPRWCGTSLMSPYLHPGPCLTPTDVKEWQGRSLFEASLK